jgi:eukaryotic-like serine/threonine-protein kinase
MELIGRRFGHIRVTEVVGSGGMGDVYAGYDEKLERRVALKVLNADQRLDEEARQRLLREARALSKLEHPNICRIHDYIETGDVDLLVLEYIDGRTLHDALNENLPRGEKLRIAISIAEVLVRAHRAGIVHRDLKPENVMLTRAGEVKVLDFGLARWLNRARKSGDSRISPVRLPVRPAEPNGAMTEAFRTPSPSDSDTGRRDFLATAVGITLGTPIFMSPEQARGETLTPASDMFSFGLLLQSLFTGRDPHPMDLTAREIILRAARGQTLPVQGVAGDVTALINRLKQFAPADRLTAIETLERLRFLQEKTQRIARRAVAAAIVLITAIGAWRYTVDLRRERANAVAARAEAERRRVEADDLINFMLGDLRVKLEPVGRLDIMDDVAEKALQYAGETRPETRSAADLARSVKALNQLGEVRIAQGRLSDATAVFDRSLALAKVAEQKDPSNAEIVFSAGQANFWAGNAYRLKNEPERSLQHMRAYLASAEKLAAHDPKNEKYQMERAFGHSSVGTILEQQDQFKPALAHYAVTLDVKRALHRANPQNVEYQDELARTLNKIGWVLQRQGDFGAARSHYESELDIRSKLVASDPRRMPWKKELATTHSYMAGVLTVTGDDAAALRHRRAELVLEGELRNHDPANVVWRRNYAMTLMWIGRLSLRAGNAAEAQEKLAGAREILQGIVRDDPQRPSWRRDLAIIEASEAAALKALGRAGAASAALDRSISRLEGETSAMGKLALADALLARGAAGDVKRAYELLAPQASGSKDPRILDPWARALALDGRMSEACAVRASLSRVGYREREFERFFSTRSCAPK